MKLGFRLEASMTLFHKQTMKELNVKETIKESLQCIEKAIKMCYYKDVPAYVEFARYIINPKDFCAVKVNGIDFHATKTV